jgi:hypothetical protein
MQNPKQWHIARMGVRSIRPGRLEKREKREKEMAGWLEKEMAGWLARRWLQMSLCPA